MEIITRSNLTCPACGHVEGLDIPPNYCLIFHRCARCGVTLRPQPGDCCVFCSYGDVRCVPEQLAARGAVEKRLQIERETHE